jgi:hypothetical protein
MIGSSTQPVEIQSGSVEREVLAIEGKLEDFGSLIVRLESAIYQVLRGSLSEAGASGSVKPSPATPLASRLCDVSSGVSNLSDRVAELISRVDI